MYALNACIFRFCGINPSHRFAISVLNTYTETELCRRRYLGYDMEVSLIGQP